MHNLLTDPQRLASGWPLEEPQWLGTGRPTQSPHGTKREANREAALERGQGNQTNLSRQGSLHLWCCDSCLGGWH